MKATIPSLSFLLLVSTISAASLPRDDSSSAHAVSLIAAAASLKPYVKPSQTVTQILAIGDSYTAGIGSDNKPDYLDGSFDCSRYRQAYPLQLQADSAWGSSKPSVVFGACSGAKMQDLVDQQLKQGDPNPNLEYTAIGKPQIAILTITGNDVGFATAINNCVYRAWFPGDCDTTLTNIANQIATQAFENQLIETLTRILAAGRQAEGASPPESFQVYIAGYVQFWNDNDPGCDDVSFSYFGWSTPKLTTDLRHRMNVLVDQLNDKIRSVAEQMAGLGVFYVDGFQSAYNAHRFCEPASQDYLKDPIGPQTWFWHSGSPYLSDTSTNGNSFDVRQETLDLLMPDKSQQAAISESNPPWKIEPAPFANEDAFFSALKKAAGNDTTALALPENLRRVFHPKGSGYAPYASAFMNTIRANRGLAASQPAPSSTAPAPPPASPTAAPFKSGVCSFHLDEYQAPCLAETEDLSASIVLKDGSGAEIGHTNSNAGINVKQPLSFNSALPHPLVVTGEHEHDYVQFTYGDVSWKSNAPMMNGTDTVAHCNTGGWDPRQGPTCDRSFVQRATRQMDCFFEC